MVNVGILGTGFGAEHARMYQQIENVTLKKVFGRTKEKLDAIEETFHASTTDDIYSILTDTSIDLIDICLPTNVHTQYIIESLQHGKHVFCETPLCYEYKETQQIHDAIKKYGRNVYVSSFMKYVPEYQYLKGMIDTNELGHLWCVNMMRNTPSIWGNLNLHNIVFNFMIHDIDFISWILGEANTISSYGMDGHENQSYVKSLFAYDRCQVHLQAASVMPRAYPLTIGYDAYFEKGYVKFDGYFTEAGPQKTLQFCTDQGNEVIPIDDRYPYYAMIEDLINKIDSHQSCELDISHSFIPLKMAREIHKSLCH